MKKPLALLLTIVAIVGAGIVPRPAQAAVSFDFFYDTLDPYGNWIEVDEYGYCWQPGGVDEEWAPYTDGYWAFTDAGWTWVSYEDWGSITYHYGRWVEIEDEGWCWVPDYEWAPAWVSWRSSDDYVGWAPLPPRARFNVSVGFSTWVDAEYDIGPRLYSFCAVRDFGSPALRPVIVDRSRNITIINKTVNITNITVRRDTNIIYNGGPRYQTIAARSARPIQTLKLVQNRNIARNARANQLLARQQGNQLVVAAPEVEKPATKIKPRKIAKTVKNARVENGWSRIKDPKVKQQVRARMREQAKVARVEDAPAKEVDPEDLKVVEEKAAAKPGADERERVVGGKAGKERPPTAAETPVATKPDEAGSATARQDKGKGKGKVARQGPDAVTPPTEVKEPGTSTQPEAGAPAAKVRAQKRAAARARAKGATPDAPDLQPFNGAAGTTEETAPAARRKRNAVPAQENQEAIAARRAKLRQQQQLQQQEGLDERAAAQRRQRLIQQKANEDAAPRIQRQASPEAAIARQRAAAGQQQRLEQQQQQQQAIRQQQAVQRQRQAVQARRPQVQPGAEVGRGAAARAKARKEKKDQEEER
jgi:hypothetical protein